MENPFKFGGIVRGRYFADRVQELDELGREMRNRGRVFLVSPRRYGKTCLLFNLLDRLREENLPAAYIDLNAHPDLASFAAGITQAVARTLETNVDKLLKIFSSLQRLRPRLTLDPDGEISAGLELATAGRDALEALLEGLSQAELLAKRKNSGLVVIIDEFSDVDKYDGASVEKGMRAEIQTHEQVGYIFAGSEQSVMLSMVNDRRRAFYKLGRIMSLGPIPHDVYLDFIVGWLEQGNIAAVREDLARLLEIGGEVPYNVQRLCHNLWEIARDTAGRVTREMVEALPDVIVRQDSPHYELIWRTVTPRQRRLLIALKSEPGAKPFSREFQLRHGIGPSSSIKASLDSLVKKGILHQGPDGAYRFLDTFMPFWIDYLGRLSRP
jgi:hypothetical protein